MLALAHTITKERGQHERLQRNPRIKRQQKQSLRNSQAVSRADRQQFGRTADRKGNIVKYWQKDSPQVQTEEVQSQSEKRETNFNSIVQ